MKCSFCSSEIEKGKGLLYVRKDGKVLSFCSRKCRVNMLQLKRKTHKIAWVKKKTRR